MKKFLRKIYLWHKAIKKAKKAKKDLLVQAEVAKKLDGYIDDFLAGKIEKYVAVAKKPELVGQKIIWQFWQQGLDENTPKIVKTCFNSVEKYRGDYEIIILSKETLNDYIELPNFVWEKFGKGGFTFPKVANLVRLYLLSTYGGVWLDATIYLTAPIEKRFLDMDFFALQRSEIPPNDMAYFNRIDPLFFTWDSDTQVKILNSFIIAKPHHKIIDDLLSVHLEYWKKEEDIGHYFFFQIMFNRMMMNPEWKNLNCERVGHTDAHKLQFIASDKFNKQLYDSVIAKSNIHKLSLYLSRKEVPVGSFLDVIVNEK